MNRRWKEVGWGVAVAIACVMVFLSDSILIGYGPIPKVGRDSFGYNASPLWSLVTCCFAYALVFFVGITRFAFAKLESASPLSSPEDTATVEFGLVRRIVRFPGAWLVAGFAAIHLSLFEIERGMTYAEGGYADPVARNFLILHALTMIVALWLVFVLVAHASFALSRWKPGKPAPRKTTMVLALVAAGFVLASQSLTIAFIDNEIWREWGLIEWMWSTSTNIPYAIWGALSLLKNDINAQSALHYIVFALLAVACLFVIQWILGENVPETWRQDCSASNSE